MSLALGRIVFWSVLASTPLFVYAFTKRYWGRGLLWNLRRMLIDYRWHLLLFLAILIEKNWVDHLNDPIRGVFGDFTWLLHAIEGDLTYKLQLAHMNASWTQFLSIHYLWMYVFLNYFSVIFFAYRDDRELASLAALNYSIIYLIAIPFYIFFNVQVTSDFIPGMGALLYHSSPTFYDFFILHDPLDNAFPSLHIAIPFGLILTIWWTMKRRGYRLLEWEHGGYLVFLIANTALFAYSILYLGIHWITDIPGGMLVGLLGATIADEFRFDFFKFMERLEKRVAKPVQLLWQRRKGSS